MSNAERALLSCLSQDPAVIGSEVLAVFQKAVPFQDNVCRRIYQAWLMTGDTTTWDVPMLLDKLSASVYACDWFTELRSVMNTLPSTEGWRSYLNAVRTEYIRLLAERELQDGLYKLTTTEDVTAHLQEVSRKLVTLDVASESEMFDVRQAVAEEQERLHKTGLVTGIPTLDELLGQLEPGEVLTIAARTSVGKSLLAGNIARNLALMQNAPGLYHSFEMPIAKVVGRMAASLTHVNSRQVLQELEKGNEDVRRAYENIYKAPIIWDERASLSMNQICNKIRRCAVNYGIKWVMLDHLGFIKLGHGKRNELIGEAIKQFKDVCKELGIVPIQVVQLNRCAVNEEPGLHHLKGAGDIEEDSSQVVLLHRDTILTNDERERVARGEALPLKVAVAKTRYGETGYRQLALFLHSSLIQDRAYLNEDIPHETQSEEEAT